MSHSHPSTASSSNFQFQLIFNDALKTYKKRTKKDLLTHPLAIPLQLCKSPSAILELLQQQVLETDQSRSSDGRWTKWLDPTVNVLFALSATLGEGVGLIFSPAKVIFAGVGVLLLAAKNVRAGQDILVDIFERVENFFRRLDVYMNVPPTTEMMEMIVQIMVEVLSILGIAMKEIKQSRMKKYGKKLVGRTDLEDALKRLDKVTQEEARMAAVEVLRVTHIIDYRARGISKQVFVVDERVASVDDKVAEVIDDGKEAKVVMEQTANDVNHLKQNQLRDNVYEWLSPSDPSTNHNIACGTHHKRTATWFFQEGIFREWESKGSLLWIHGKPGSGKSILCSTIIEEVQATCDTGQASMAYFYFDFRDTSKQGLRNLVPSLLTQLSAHSGPRCDILSDLYVVHDRGRKQPSDSALIKCLKDMLTLPDQRPIYLIMDALDESPNSSGIPSAREEVLQLVKELVDLRHPNLRICVTSRPEIDIIGVFEPLTPLRVSLHDQSEQKKDIADYVRSVVYSNSEPIIRRWKKEEKDLVIEILSERADGMFRWVFCQLEILRHCLPSSVRRFLEELPESLDETYERVLREIKKPNRDHALRLLHCLVVANRPLRVEELAEVLAVDFDDAEGIPRLNPGWRWDDQDQALLTSCSSLIAIVDTGHFRIVQFSHFSVKEYLTSARLATSTQDLSRYHISLERAHTILAQACLGILLQPKTLFEPTGVAKPSPLAGYAAEHWVVHAQIENVSLRLRRAMEYLFDPDMPHFTAWLQLHDIDIDPDDESSLFEFTPIMKSASTPLYYAALCGFQHPVEQLIAKYPQSVDAIGGYCMTPAVAALAGRHFRLARLLHRSGSSVDPQGDFNKTPLHSAACYGDLEMVQTLLDCKANVNARAEHGSTPLKFALSRPSLSDARVIRLLLEHGADPNIPAIGDLTPLHHASEMGWIEAVHLLIEHGASVEVKDNDGRTPLEVASGEQREEIVKLLLEHCAKFCLVRRAPPSISERLT